jgi:hypothetical protein
LILVCYSISSLPTAARLDYSTTDLNSKNAKLVIVAYSHIPCLIRRVSIRPGLTQCDVGARRGCTHLDTVVGRPPYGVSNALASGRSGVARNVDGSSRTTHITMASRGVDGPRDVVRALSIPTGDREGVWADLASVGLQRLIGGEAGHRVPALRRAVGVVKRSGKVKPAVLRRLRAGLKLTLAKTDRQGLLRLLLERGLLWPVLLQLQLVRGERSGLLWLLRLQVMSRRPRTGGLIRGAKVRASSVMEPGLGAVG